MHTLDAIKRMRHYQNLCIGETREAAHPWGEADTHGGGSRTAERMRRLKLATNDTDEQTSEIEQSLDELVREEAHRIILAALELEVEQYL